MGCDGGTIPTRDELVRVKKKPEQKDKDAEIVAKWKYCQITQQPLEPPIVACELGKLYKKDSVIEYLLDKSKFEGTAGFDHIRGLKDVKELQFTEHPGYKAPESDKGGVYIDRRAARYICPITGLEMSGKHTFVYLWTCACVLSQRALKEVKMDTCVKCGEPFSSSDVVILNGSTEEIEELWNRMEDKRTKARLEKKSKKKQKSETATAPEGSTSLDSTEGPSTSKKAKLDPVAGTSKGKSSGNGKAASSNGKLSSKIAGSKSKLASSILGEKSFTSVQNDPRASKTFKSLFTTSEAAKNRPTAHWVTYNPQYN